MPLPPQRLPDKGHRIAPMPPAQGAAPTPLPGLKPTALQPFVLEQREGRWRIRFPHKTRPTPTQCDAAATHLRAVTSSLHQRFGEPPTAAQQRLLDRSVALAGQFLRHHILKSPPGPLSDAGTQLAREVLALRLEIPVEALPDDFTFLHLMWDGSMGGRLRHYGGRPGSTERQQALVGHRFPVRMGVTELELRVDGTWQPWSVLRPELADAPIQPALSVGAAGFRRQKPIPPKLDLEKAPLGALRPHAVVLEKRQQSDWGNRFVITLCSADMHAWLHLKHPDGSVYSLGVGCGGAFKGPIDLQGHRGAALPLDPGSDGAMGPITQTDFAVDEAVWTEALRDHLKAQRDGFVYHQRDANCARFATETLERAGHAHLGEVPLFEAQSEAGWMPQHPWARVPLDAFAVVYSALYGAGTVGPDLQEALQAGDKPHLQTESDALGLSATDSWLNRCWQALAGQVGPRPTIVTGASVRRVQRHIEDHRHRLRDQALAAYRSVPEDGRKAALGTLLQTLERARWALPASLTPP